MSLDFATAWVKVSWSKTAWSLIDDPRDLDLAVAAVEHLVGLDHLLLDPGGGGDDLEDAARLEDVGDRAVAPARSWGRSCSGSG